MWAGFASNAMSRPAINMGVVPCDMHCEHYILKNYILNHCPNIKYVVLGLDIDLWYNIDSHADINANLGGASGFKYDADNAFYPNGIDDEFIKLVMVNAPNDAVSIIEDHGWHKGMDNIEWYNADGTSDITDDSTWSDCLLTQEFSDCLADENFSLCYSNTGVCSEYTTVTECLKTNKFDQCPARYSSGIERLKKILMLAKERNIIVVGVLFPMSPYYKTTGAYGRHGLRRSHAIKLIEEFSRLAETEANFILMDENKLGNHDYPSSLANDFDHLNMEGAKRFTSRLDALLKTLE